MLISDNENIKKTKCPYCRSGLIIIRENMLKKSQFLGCSNYPVCNQTFDNTEIINNNQLCAHCRSGFMTKKSGRFGNFLGCTNYPKCKNTIKLKW